MSLPVVSDVVLVLCILLLDFVFKLPELSFLSFMIVFSNFKLSF
jgi:hypothetical protein